MWPLDIAQQPRDVAICLVCLHGYEDFCKYINNQLVAGEGRCSSGTLPWVYTAVGPTDETSVS